MKSLLTVILGGTLVLGGTLLAQAPGPDIAALKERVAQNQAALKQYSWVESTVVTVKGEVKKQEQKQCYYGADGKVQKTATSAPAPQQEQARGGGGGRRGGRVAGRVVENKIEDTKEYVEKVVALVHEYVPPDGAKIGAAQSAGNVAMQPSGAGRALNIKNYIKNGDLVAIGFDAASKLASFSVQSYVEKPKDDDVNLTVTFARLDDGTAYPQQVLLEIKAKNIQVKVTNSGYKKAAAN